MTTVVYVSNAGSAEISVLRLDSDGSVRPVQTVSVTGAVMPLVISPDRRYLYASLRSVPYSVACFEIDPGTGELRATGTVPLPDSMAYLSVDRGGRYLLGASYTGNVISVNAIAPGGHVDSMPIEVLPTPPHAHSIVTDPSNRYLFATALGGDVILQFLFDPATGRPTPNSPAVVATKPDAGPRHLLFHPGGRFVYVSNELDGTVGCFEFDRDTGCLAASDTYSVMPEGLSEPWTAELRCTPDGKYLYISERRSSTLTGFEIDAVTGALRSLGHTATETCPRGFAIDPSGRYLLAAGQQSDALTVYAIEPGTGALTPLARQFLGRDPNWVEIIALPEPDA
ncbi:beta-propeller fold lactonase family protein [Nocardia sp. NPDC051030]|uniref:lactonase family protein n=1 Tax=Nocardia sp. NPDC051030 TaxID=3155162 RepID=UPI00342E4454